MTIDFGMRLTFPAVLRGRHAFSAAFQTTLIAAAILCLRGASIRAQVLTYGIDGNWWANAGGLDAAAAQQQKLTFLRGFYEAVEFAQAREAYAYPTRTTWDALIFGLDTFYADEENRPIVVAFALRILDLRLHGRPAAEVDRAIRYERCAVKTRGEENVVRRDSLATVCQRLP